MQNIAPGHPTDLPRTVRLFPLSGVVLLPRAHIPLQIFEPRYLSMVADSMASDQSIAIIQPRNEAEPPALYEVGTLSRITSYSEPENGRLLITLSGINRFRLVAEPAVPTAYRQAEVDYAPFAEDRNPAAPLPASTRFDLEATLRRYLQKQDLSADWDAIHSADDESLVHSLSAACPFSVAERQALLESPNLTTRTAALTTLMRFAEAEPAGSGLQ